jgi:hypothetical protein
MRKFILIAAFALISATAQAGVTRGLTLASSDDAAAAAAQPKTAGETGNKAVEAPKTPDAQKPAETPSFVARPAAVEPAAQAPQPDQVQPVPEKRTATARADKPKRRHDTTEARVISELHRYGIYW